ncbi:transporter [Xaviernesmea oryzae]|uniref:Transporter n=1 Tax=Xaviernesmea oryzae TaxID=464029 RepID=A0A1Q9B2Q4_9HYPH|nr:EamA family transporter [Xaviernesmea oryzae]OLP62301.1 transporter [Xaviernesmea oryzae]SEL96107.1 transporter family protein [Xaviernesmea oryzae]
MKSMLEPWQAWALMSAIFAALTAIFAKIGVGDMPSDVATFLRTLVVIALLALILSISGQWGAMRSLSRQGTLFLVLSGLATGASWLCYFRALKAGEAARVAPLDKLSVVLVAVFGVLFLGEKLSGPNWLGVALIAAGAVLVAYRS